MKIEIWADLDAAAQAAVLQRPAMAGGDEALRQSVAAIIDAVRRDGDAALRAYAAQFDKVELDDVRVPAADMAAAGERIDPAARKAIDDAHARITRYHTAQGYMPYEAQTEDGVLCARMVRPLSPVGLYVPGGSAPLVSTALMLGVPARLAGCKDIVMCTPCGPDGQVNPHILYAAQLCGITRIYRVGGAQAIAAMAYGTATIPKVHKIFGPGNAYVTCAKTLVAQDRDGAALDMPAGPSEVLVIADDTTPPDFAAADLLAQAEHDPLSQVVLLATSRDVCAAILDACAAQLADLPRRAIAAAALQNSVALVVKDLQEAVALSNRYAPEHLILCFETADDYVALVENAGSVFVGLWATESAGDYTSGTNHVLPTYGYARAYSGLTVEAFQKTMSVQRLSPQGLLTIAPTIETLAGLEGLAAHARAATVRAMAAQEKEKGNV